MIFKDIPQFERLYRISDTGVVISYDRILPMPHGGFKIIKSHYPKLSITKKGYLKVMLSDINGIRKGYFVHRLVLSTFLHNSLLQVNHKDANKQNNNLFNLEWTTNRENTSKRFDKTKTSSKYTGVIKIKNRWLSRIQINGKICYLGVFDKEEDAHIKYIENIP